MSENIKKISDVQREIELEIPAEKVEQELDRIISEYSAKARIKGFRKGSASKKLVKRLYFPEIKQTLIDSLVPKALHEVLKEHSINPVGQPIVSDLQFKETEPLRIKAKVEVWPELYIPDYKNIKVKRRKATVAQEEVKQSLEELRVKAADYVPIKGRGVTDGDYVVAEIKGRDTKTRKLLPSEKVVILAGHPDNEDALNQNIMELKPEEKTQFTILYKKDHPNKKLAGKNIMYDLKVESIKEKKIPEIDDDFAKDLGKYKNLEELKEKIKEQILVSKKKAHKREMAEEIIKKISDQMVFGLPESVIERESLALMKHKLSAESQKNFTKDDYEKLQNEARSQAVQNIKNHLILTKIAEMEKLHITEEEMTEEMKAIAKAHDVPFARVVESINKEEKKEELRDNLLIKKTIDFLVESAIIE
jgi:trigger factor